MKRRDSDDLPYVPTEQTSAQLPKIQSKTVVTSRPPGQSIPQITKNQSVQPLINGGRDLMQSPQILYTIRKIADYKFYQQSGKTLPFFQTHIIEMENSLRTSYQNSTADPVQKLQKICFIIQQADKYALIAQNKQRSVQIREMYNRYTAWAGVPGMQLYQDFELRILEDWIKNDMEPNQSEAKQLQNVFRQSGIRYPTSYNEFLNYVASNVYQWLFQNFKAQYKKYENLDIPKIKPQQNNEDILQYQEIELRPQHFDVSFKKSPKTLNQQQLQLIENARLQSQREQTEDVPKQTPQVLSQILNANQPSANEQTELCKDEVLKNQQYILDKQMELREKKLELLKLQQQMAANSIDPPKATSQPNNSPHTPLSEQSKKLLDDQQKVVKPAAMQQKTKAKPIVLKFGKKELGIDQNELNQKSTQSSNIIRKLQDADQNLDEHNIQIPLNTEISKLLSIPDASERLAAFSSLSDYDQKSLTDFSSVGIEFLKSLEASDKEAFLQKLAILDPEERNIFEKHWKILVQQDNDKDSEVISLNQQEASVRQKINNLKDDRSEKELRKLELQENYKLWCREERMNQFEIENPRSEDLSDIDYNPSTRRNGETRPFFENSEEELSDNRKVLRYNLAFADQEQISNFDKDMWIVQIRNFYHHNYVLKSALQLEYDMAGEVADIRIFRQLNPQLTIQKMQLLLQQMKDNQLHHPILDSKHCYNQAEDCQKISYCMWWFNFMIDSVCPWQRPIIYKKIRENFLRRNKQFEFVSSTIKQQEMTQNQLLTVASHFAENYQFCLLDEERILIQKLTLEVILKIVPRPIIQLSPALTFMLNHGKQAEQFYEQLYRNIDKSSIMWEENRLQELTNYRSIFIVSQDIVNRIQNFSKKQILESNSSNGINYSKSCQNYFFLQYQQIEWKLQISELLKLCDQQYQCHDFRFGVEEILQVQDKLFDSDSYCSQQKILVKNMEDNDMFTDKNSNTFTHDEIQKQLLLFFQVSQRTKKFNVKQSYEQIKSMLPPHQELQWPDDQLLDLLEDKLYDNDESLQSVVNEKQFDPAIQKHDLQQQYFSTQKSETKGQKQNELHSIRMQKLHEKYSQLENQQTNRQTLDDPFSCLDHLPNDFLGQKMRQIRLQQQATDPFDDIDQMILNQSDAQGLNYKQFQEACQRHQSQQDINQFGQNQQLKQDAEFNLKAQYIFGKAVFYNQSASTSAELEHLLLGADGEYQIEILSEILKLNDHENARLQKDKDDEELQKKQQEENEKRLRQQKEDEIQKQFQGKQSKKQKQLKAKLIGPGQSKTQTVIKLEEKEKQIRNQTNTFRQSQHKDKSQISLLQEANRMKFIQKVKYEYGKRLFTKQIISLFPLKIVYRIERINKVYPEGREVIQSEYSELLKQNPDRKLSLTVQRTKECLLYIVEEATDKQFLVHQSLEQEIGVISDSKITCNNKSDMGQEQDQIDMEKCHQFIAQIDKDQKQVTENNKKLVDLGAQMTQKIDNVNSREQQNQQMLNKFFGTDEFAIDDFNEEQLQLILETNPKFMVAKSAELSPQQELTSIQQQKIKLQNNLNQLKLYQDSQNKESVKQNLSEEAKCLFERKQQAIIFRINLAQTESTRITFQLQQLLSKEKALQEANQKQDRSSLELLQEMIDDESQDKKVSEGRLQLLNQLKEEVNKCSDEQSRKQLIKNFVNNDFDQLCGSHFYSSTPSNDKLIDDQTEVKQLEKSNSSDELQSLMNAEISEINYQLGVKEDEIQKEINDEIQSLYRSISDRQKPYSPSTQFRLNIAQPSSLANSSQVDEDKQVAEDIYMQHEEVLNEPQCKDQNILELKQDMESDNRWCSVQLGTQALKTEGLEIGMQKSENVSKLPFMLLDDKTEGQAQTKSRNVFVINCKDEILDRQQQIYHQYQVSEPQKSIFDVYDLQYEQESFLHKNIQEIYKDAKIEDPGIPDLQECQQFTKQHFSEIVYVLEKSNSLQFALFVQELITQIHVSQNVVDIEQIFVRITNKHRQRFLLQELSNKYRFVVYELSRQRQFRIQEMILRFALLNLNAELLKQYLCVYSELTYLEQLEMGDGYDHIWPLIQQFVMK